MQSQASAPRVELAPARATELEAAQASSKCKQPKIKPSKTKIKKSKEPDEPSCTTKLCKLVVSDDMSLMCVLRAVPEKTKLAPYFILRELDTKILKKLTSDRLEEDAMSEQSRRAHIRTSLLKLRLEHDAASRAEIGLIKKKDPSILGVHNLFFLFCIYHYSLSSPFLARNGLQVHCSCMQIV